MRAFLISVVTASATLALVCAATAQERSDRFVMHVGAGPTFTTSLGFAQGDGGQVAIQERLEMGPGCRWTPSAPITVPASDVVDVQEPSSVGGAERFGVLYAVTYSAIVAQRGG